VKSIGDGTEDKERNSRFIQQKLRRMGHDLDIADVLILPG